MKDLNKTYALFIVVALLEASIVILMFVALGHHKWIYQGEASNEWSGGLIFYQVGTSTYKGNTYKEVADDVCPKDQPLRQAECELYEELWTAGLWFILLELFAIVSTLFWFIGTMYQMK